MFPTFVVIGAAKCGTTSLCDLIAGHPEAFVTDPKEPHFFSSKTDEEYRERRSWYESLYEGSEACRARGEGSTSQTNPHRVSFAAERLSAAVPDCRLIYMVRHPVRRLESDWKMRSNYGRVSAPISDAVSQHPSLVTYGLYWQHLSHYRRRFSDEQILVVFLEDFTADPNRELRRVFQHIGVDPSYTPPDADKPRMAAKDFRKYGRVANWLRKLPGFEAMKAALPQGMVRTVKGLTTRPVKFEVAWDPTIRQSVSEGFREDSAALLAYCGKPPDFWKL